MHIQLIDLLKAVDDLETLKRKIFEDFTPIWDEDERLMTRALATLHALVKELNQ